MCKYLDVLKEAQVKREAKEHAYEHSRDNQRRKIRQSAQEMDYFLDGRRKKKKHVA